jgi:hypothetical protein
VFIIIIEAKESDQRGNHEKAKSKGTAALVLNIIAIIWWFVGGFCIVGGVVGVVVRSVASGLTGLAGLG